MGSHWESDDTGGRQPVKSTESVASLVELADYVDECAKFYFSGAPKLHAAANALREASSRLAEGTREDRVIKAARALDTQLHLPSDDLLDQPTIDELREALKEFDAALSTTPASPAATSANWEEEATRYAQNASYWRERAERCEASPRVSAGTPAPAKCDGEHGGPRCGDPECWNDDPTHLEEYRRNEAQYMARVSPRPCRPHRNRSRS